KAKILPKTSNYNDKNPSNPKTDVDIIGIDRNTIDIISLDTSDIHIEVRGITNCNITEKSSFDIKYKSINNDIKNITLCPNQKTYDDPFFKDDIITPNDTCGKIKTYNYLHVESIGCKYNVTLHVSKTCDTSTIRDLGTFNICKNSFFVMDNIIYKDTNFVYQTNPNFVINNDKSICKKELRFKLSELKPSKNILQNGYIYCNSDKITLYTPKIEFASNTKVAYQWEKRTSSGWVKIPNATKDTLLVEDAGTYRLFQDYKVQNVINQAIFTGEYCNMTFYSDTITINQKAIIATPNIAAIGKKCIGNTITLSPTLPDVNLTYHWLDSDGNNSQNNEFNVSLSKNPLKVCLIANSNCGTNSDTICKDFIGVDSLKEKPSFSGIKQYCVGEPLILTIDNFDPNIKYSWIYPIDSMDIAVKNNTADFAAYFPGNYPITLLADNGCNELSSTNDFSFENQLSKSKIYGSSIVNEKTSQSYCLYTGQNNVTWKSSKGLKFKQSYKNGQSCISVSFPKISSSGWITATHSNSCSSITDSIYVIVKPVLFSNQLSKSNNIEAITEQHQDLEENQFKITPNPSNGNFSISSSFEFDKIEVMNIIGRAIYFDNSNNNQFNISEFPSGLYIVSLVKNGQKIGSKKLMKVD
ncbi:MAG: T9SS type A sorting domain-containing protein, partial [Saprospiraceae bacterium]|nr:T9SS type A sorting domain-containing protein [Saprospiraceae bacterium]